MQIEPTSILAETKALELALQFTRDIGITKLECESDSKVLITAILARDFSHKDYGHIIYNILQLATTFQFFSFNWINRLANKAVDSLSKNSRTDGQLSTWMEEPPDFLTAIILQDISNIYLINGS